MTAHERMQQHSQRSFRQDLPPAEMRQDLPSPEHVLERIKMLTGELEALAGDIYGQITDPAELLVRRAMLERAGGSSVFGKFKGAIDQLRSILWFCSAELSSSEVAEFSAERERQVVRAAELLDALSPSTPMTPQAGSGSFFERLDRVIDTYLQDTLPPQKPVRSAKH